MGTDRQRGRPRLLSGAPMGGDRRPSPVGVPTPPGVGSDGPEEPRGAPAKPMNTVQVALGPGSPRTPAGPPCAVAGQGLLLTVAGLLLVPAVATTVMRLVPPTDDATALAASFIAYGVIAYAVALLCLLVALIRARRRLALGHPHRNRGAVDRPASGLARTAVRARPAGRPYPAVHRDEPQHVRRAGRPGPGGRRWREQADIVILVEVTPAALQALAESGLEQALPVLGRNTRRRVSAVPPSTPASG